MKKNMYFRLMYQRDNAVKKFIYNVFYDFGCFMRIYIEVFIRKNFGERYFNIVSAIGAILFVGFYLLMRSFINYLSHDTFRLLAGTGPGNEEHHFFKDNWMLLAYLAVFLFVSIKHHIALKHEPSVYDFQKFSLSSGTIHEFFWNLKLNGKVADFRTVQIFYEPLPFFIGGVILAFMGQSLGWFLIIASLCYGLSYFGAFYRGDQIILDKIDEMIMNEGMENAFVNDDTSGGNSGVKFYARKPNSRELRQKVADSLMVNEEIEEDVTLV